MRVLFVINGLDEGGGAERSLIEILPRLTAKGVEGRVACLKVLPDPYGARELGETEVILLPSTLPSRLVSLRSEVRRFRPDLVHTSLFEADIAGRVSAWGSGTPVLTSLVNTTYDAVRLGDPRVSRMSLAAHRAVDGLTARHMTTHFHAVSQAVKDSAVSTLGVPADRVTVIQRGRDPSRLGEPGPERRRRARATLGLSDDDEVVVSVGRQTYQKGHSYMAEAFAQLASRRRQMIWLLVGSEGDATAQLLSSTEAHGVEGRVRFLGLRNDVPDVLAAADLFVHPSLYEGFPGALLEAMALGLPSVASDIPPIREAVLVGRTSLLVPPGSPSAIADAMAALLDDPARRAALGSAARQLFLDRYTVERSGERMADLMDEVAQKGARRLLGGHRIRG